MSAIVLAGEKIVDFSFAHPPAQRLLELGCTGFVGYISVPPASPGKNLSPSECRAYLDAGLKGWLVWEMDAARPNKGETYGAMDGPRAAEQAYNRGYPTDVALLSAADLNTFVDNINAHEAYMRAFGATCKPYFMGIYGDTDILARTVGLWHMGWVPVGAWAWSGTSYQNAVDKAKAIGAHVLQKKGYYIDNRWAVDPNDVIRDCRAWSAEETPAPQPPQGDEDMQSVATFEVEGMPGIWMWGPGMPEPIPFTNPTDYVNLATALGAAGKGTKISKEMFERLFIQAGDSTPVTIPALVGQVRLVPEG